MMLALSRFLQLLLMGLYTGILLGDRVGVTPIRPKLPTSSFVLFQQELHLQFGKLMPLLLFGSLLAGIVSLVLTRQRYKSLGFIFTAIATFCIACTAALTLLINVPVNETLMTWKIPNPPENVMQLWAPWEGSHTIRTIISLIGFAFLALSSVVRDQRPEISGQ